MGDVGGDCMAMLVYNCIFYIATLILMDMLREEEVE